MIKIVFDNSVEGFIRSLEKAAIAKVLRVIDLLEKFGHQLGWPHSKKMGADLFELRVHGQQEVRLFYTFQQNRVIMLCGFIKKTQALQAREIERAKQKLK